MMRHPFLSFALVALCGCVSTPGPITSGTVCGKPVTYHEDDLKPCPAGASACARRVGDRYQVHLSSLDPLMRPHEEEHVCGMRHREPWVPAFGQVCTQVTEGGSTDWREGDVMCRSADGQIRRNTDPRIKAYLQEVQR
jgi:hypothetical protein